MVIREGEIFLLPSMIPHSPQRPADTVGLVIEHKRADGAEDGLRWYCESCNEVLYEEFFYMTDIVGQLGAAIRKFTESDELRTCGNCGAHLDM